MHSTKIKANDFQMLRCKLGEERAEVSVWLPGFMSKAAAASESGKQPSAALAMMSSAVEPELSTVSVDKFVTAPARQPSARQKERRL